MANYVWVLSERRNVNVEGSVQTLKAGQTSTGVWVYSDFEKAMRDMLRLIRAHARSDNGLFDGDGNIVGFNEYLYEIDEEERWSPEPKTAEEASFYRFWTENHGGYENTESAYAKIAAVPELLRDWLLEESDFTPFDIPEGGFTDSMIGVKASPEQISVEGVDDGPCNGIDPCIRINTFKMDDPDKEYQFCVRNTFEERFDEPETYVYIELMKVEVDEEFRF